MPRYVAASITWRQGSRRRKVLPRRSRREDHAGHHDRRGPHADEKRVGRWERGEVRWPQPAYRRVLKALTGRPAQELGFVPPYEETLA